MAVGRLANEADLRAWLDDYTGEIRARVQTLWDSSGGGGGVTDQHIRDVAGAEIVAGTGISVGYNGTNVTVTNTSPGGGGVGVHALLSASHTDTVASSPTRGDLIVGNATSQWARLPHPAIGGLGSGYFLQHAGATADAQWLPFDSTVRGSITANYPLQWDSSTGNVRIAAFPRGGLITSQTAFTVPSILALGVSGTYLRSDGLDPAWAPVVSADVSDFAEGVDDRVAVLLKPGPGIALSYNDTLGQLLITANAAAYSDDQAQDAVGNLLTDTATIDFTYTKSARWNTPNWNAFNWNAVAGITAVIKPLSIDNSMISNTAGIALSKLAVDPLARANHTGTQLAATISDFSTAVTALLTDANIPDTITLSNITQITTRAHASLQSLAADDHSIYALLAGRSGGQSLIGGTAAGDTLTLQGSSAGGDIIFDRTTDQTRTTNWKVPTSLTAAVTALQVGSGQTLTMGAGGGIRALVVGPAVTWNGNVNGVPFLLFNFNVATTYDNLGTATNVSAKTVSIYRATPTWGVTGAGAGTIKTLDNRILTYSPIYSTTLAGSTVTRDIAAFYQPTVNDANWTITDGFAVQALKPLGSAAGTFTRWGGLYVADPAGITPVITTPLSVYSLGASVQLQHAGPGVFGAAAAPTNASVGLEVQSTTKALLISRMTGTQAAALTAVDGMAVYVTDNAGAAPFNTGPGWFFRDNGAWVKK